MGATLPFSPTLYPYFMGKCGYLWVILNKKSKRYCHFDNSVPMTMASGDMGIYGYFSNPSCRIYFGTPHAK